jgi:hypothetical protein
MHGGVIRIVAVITAAWGLLAPCAAAGGISPEGLTDEHVRLAIDALVDELYERKDPGRFWEPAKPPSGQSQRQGGGYTALTVLAMLYAGQSYQEPRLRDAVEFLQELDMNGTYAVGVRAHVWALLPARFTEHLEADARWLMEGFSPRARGWAYVANPRYSRQDNSLRQYGALGLWEAAKRGARIDRRLWQMLEEAFLEAQLPDGGWNYECDGDPPRGSMTAAGLMVLFITQDFLHADAYLKLNRRQEPPAAEAMQRGLEWMESNFSPSRNPGLDAHFYYYLYGVERVGLASGYRRFGPHDWYREGAAELLRRLCTWDEEDRTMTMREHNFNTGNLAFALMFLSRGRVPVAVNKLQMPDIAWNNRPRDAANLTDWIRDYAETPLSWQIVSMAEDPQRWLDAPLVYVASDELIPWFDFRRFDLDGYREQVRQFQRRRAAGEVALDEAPPAAPEVRQFAAIKRYLDLGGSWSGAICRRITGRTRCRSSLPAVGRRCGGCPTARGN